MAETVTVLFTDLKSSTEMLHKLGEREAQKLWRTYFSLLRDSAKARGGQEVKNLGDGLMVAFPSVREAVACAVDMQRGVFRHNRRLSQSRNLQVRVGLHVGEPIHEEEDYFGISVVAAKRLCDCAEGGQILASGTVRGIAGALQDIEFVERGLYELKGFPEKWRLYEVVWKAEEPPATFAFSTLSEQTPFVDRERELEELRPILEQAFRGHGSFVTIGGEPGVGKTRFTQELEAEALASNMLSFTGHCYGTGVAPPYIAFTEIFESLIRTLDRNVVLSILGDSAPLVAKFMPDLRRLLPNISTPPELPPDQESRFLFKGVCETIARAARLQPQLLILEDLQWSDESTLLLLEHLGTRLHDIPVFVIGTYRDVDLDNAPSLARILNNLGRQHLVHKTILKRLPKDDVAAMLKGRAGQDPPAPLAQAIFNVTEGNPLFVEEIFKHLAEEGKLFSSEGGWHTNLEVDEPVVPQGVRWTIEYRLKRVSEECRRTLTAAAILGRGFTFELLSNMVDIDETALLDAIDAAEAAQLISSKAEDGEVMFTFFHELIRQTLLSNISPPRRQRLHLRAAKAMELVFADTIEEHSTELAYHFSEAGTLADLQKTVHYLRLAGDEAFNMGAIAEAIRLYGSTLSLGTADEIQAEIRYRLGLAYSCLGRLDEALDEWRKSLALYEQLDKPEAVGNVCSDISRRLLWASRFPEALEISNRGLAALGDRMNAARCVLLAASGHVLAYVQAVGYELPHSMFTQALEMAAKLGEKELEGPILFRKAMFHRNYWQGPEETECALRSAEILRAENNPFDTANALLAAEWGLIGVGRLAEAARVERELESLAAGTVAELNRCVLDLYSCLREVIVTGNLERLEKRISAALQESLALQWGWIYMDYVLLGWAQFWRGKWELAEKHYWKALEIMDPRAEGFVGYLISPLLVFLSCSGKQEEALGLIEQRKNLLPLAGQANMLGAWTMLEGTIQSLATLGKYDEAAKLYPLAREAVATGNIVSPSCAGLVQTTAGIAAAAGEEWDSAEEHFRTALKQAHRLPHVIEQPEVQRWYARMLIRRNASGDKEKARNLLYEAIETYRRLGMPKSLESAETLLKKL